MTCSDVVFDDEGDPKQLKGCSGASFGLRIPPNAELKRSGDKPPTWSGSMGGWSWSRDGESYCCPGLWLVDPSHGK